MVTLAVFALGLFCGSLGVFSFLLLEAIVCAAAFVDGWSAGLGGACLESVEMGADLTAGFVVALLVSFPAAKLGLTRASRPQRSQAGLAEAGPKRDAGFESAGRRLSGSELRERTAAAGMRPRAGNERPELAPGAALKPAPFNRLR